MPTMLTQDIYSGKDTSLRNYLLRVGRSFGCYASMRDDSSDAPLRTEFEPSAYVRESLDEAIENLKKAESMTLEEAGEQAECAYQKILKEYEEQVKEREELKARYGVILKKLESWAPPTDDHMGVLKLARKQILECIQFDCRNPLPLEDEAPMSAEEFRDWVISEAKREVDYLTKQWDKEVELAKERTEWSRAFIESLPKD